GFGYTSPSTTSTSMIMRRLRIPTDTCTTSTTYTNTILNGTNRRLTRISTYTSHYYTATRTIRTFTTGIVTKLRLSCEKGCIQMAPLNVLPYPCFKRALNFGPLSGSEPKLKRPAERYIWT